MQGISIFKQTYAAGASRVVMGFDSAINTYSPYAIGCIVGKSYAMAAAVVNEDSDQWHIVNLNTKHGFDAVAVLGAIDEDDAASIAMRDFGRFKESAMWDSVIATNTGGLKRYIDSPLCVRGRKVFTGEIGAMQDMAAGQKIIWDGIDLQSHQGSSRALLTDMVHHDDESALVEKFDGLNAWLAELDAEILEFDALVVENYRLEQTMAKLASAMGAASGQGGVSVTNVTQTKAVKLRNSGAIQVGVSFELSDGQTVTAIFNHADSETQKLGLKDTLFSWKWKLNSRDISAAVQPNNFENVKLDILAGRIMKLVNANSARFQRSQAKKLENEQALADSNARIAEKKATIESLKSEIESLHGQIEEQAKVQANVQKDDVEKQSNNDAAISSWDGAKAEGDFSLILQKNNNDYVKSAKEYFTAKLQGKNVKTKIGVVSINSKSRGKMLHRVRPVSASVIPLIPEILISGSVGGREELNKERSDDFVAFHTFEKTVSVNNANITARIKVGELSNGLLAYYLASKKEAPSFDSSWVDDESKTRGQEMGLDSITPQDDDGINIEILKIIDKNTGKELTEEEAEKLLFGDSEKPNETQQLDVEDQPHEPEQHYSEKIIAQLIAAHGWTKTDTTNSAEKEFAGLGEAGLLSDGGRIVYATFIGDAQRYLSLQFGYDDVLDMDMRPYDGDDEAIAAGAKEFNAKVEAWVLDKRGVGVAAKDGDGDGEPIVLTGKELGDFPDTAEGKKALRTAAKAEFEKLLGQWVDCPALDGVEGDKVKVEIRKRGIKEFMAFSGDPRKLKLVAAIGDLIKTATLINHQIENNYKQEKKKEIICYYHLTNQCLVDGEKIKVRIIVEKDTKGLLHYDVIVPKSIAFEKGLDSIDKQITAENLITIQGQPSSSNLTDIGIDVNIQKDETPSFDGALSTTTASDRGVAENPLNLPVSCVANVDTSMQQGENLVNEFDAAGEKYVLNLFIQVKDEHGNWVDLDDEDDFKDESEAKSAEYMESEISKQEDGAAMSIEELTPLVNAGPSSSNEDADYLNSIINGFNFAAADLDELENKLEAISERLTPETEDLFEQAAEAFAQYAISLEV